MANWSTLKAAVANVIKTNGNNEITGALLQSTLNSIISNLGENYQFVDIATTTTVPGTPDGNVFYMAIEKGTYPNFEGIILGVDDGIAILAYNGTWSKKNIPIASAADVVQLNEDMTQLRSDLNETNANLSGLQISYIIDRKYIAVIIDSESKVLFGIKKDGTIDFKSSELNTLETRMTSNEESIVTLTVEVNSIQDIIDSLAEQISTLAFLSTIVDRKYLATFTDTNNKILLGIKKSGKIDAKLESVEELKILFNDLVIQNDNNTEAIASVNDKIKIITDRKYIAVIIDSESRVLFGIKRDGTIDFKSSELSEFIAELNTLSTRLTLIESFVSLLVMCWGDSLTAANIYEVKLKELAGENYTILNGGVGGETVDTIAARQGGIPMYIPFSITIPTDVNTYVKIADKATNEYLKSIYDNSHCTPLYQAAFYDTVNPITIDGIECTMSIYSPSSSEPTASTDAQWRVKRNVAGTARTIQSGTIIYTSGAKKRNALANTFWLGQNGGWSSPEDLSIKHDKMISFSNTENYIIIGLHTGTLASRNALETYFKAKYGLRYFNLREYFVKHGLEDAGLTPTQADLDAIAVGSCPPQLLRDGLHCTDAAYNLIGIQLYNIFKQLNVIK